MRNVILAIVVIFVLGAAYSAPPQAQSGGRFVLLTAATTGTSAAVNAAECSSLALYATGTGTLSTGIITLEEADYAGASAAYAGTWASLGTVTPVSGAQLVLRPTNALGSAFRFVRARVSTTVTGGGSVSAVLACRR